MECRWASPELKPVTIADVISPVPMNPSFIGGSAFLSGSMIGTTKTHLVVGHLPDRDRPSIIFQDFS
jgi:hypothetical protein